MEQRVSLITLGVADLSASRRFYEAGLGWRGQAGGSGEGSVVAFQLGGMVLALFGRGAMARDMGLPEAAAPGGITLAHNVRSKAEVDAVLAEAVAAGARLLKPGADTFWGGYTGGFADPDGHAWEIAWNPHSPLLEDGSFRWQG